MDDKISILFISMADLNYTDEDFDEIFNSLKNIFYTPKENNDKYSIENSNDDNFKTVRNIFKNIKNKNYKYFFFDSVYLPQYQNKFIEEDYKTLFNEANSKFNKLWIIIIIITIILFIIIFIYFIFIIKRKKTLKDNKYKLL